MISYYNEFDPKAAAWLKQLIKNGNITNGEVDERSITEVKADDLMGFRRAHFFAGIGTWDYCLNEAGWGGRQVWTASLPCQPFSVAGKRLGKDDERHLLPHFMELVRQCKPDTIFGEQVAAAIKHGWLDDLHANMEAEGYAIGHVVFGAHSVGAAHIRQRLYWVAHTKGERVRGIGGVCDGKAGINEAKRGQENRESFQFIAGGTVVRMGITHINGCEQGGETTKAARYRNTADSAGRVDSGMGNTRIESSERNTRSIFSEETEISREGSEHGHKRFGYSDASEIYWLYCRDNKYRPIKSCIKPLVDGSTSGVVYSGDPSQQINADYSQEARAMRLKGYGNAIVSQCGIEFIKTFMDIEQWKTA